MANPAYYDFFRKILLQPDGITLEADSTTDTLTITSGTGVNFNPNASNDSFEIDVDYQLYVPVGTTDIRLEDINNNTRDLTITGGTNIVVTRGSNNELVISAPAAGGGAGVDLQTITDLGANTTNQITIDGSPVLTEETGFTHFNITADDSTVRTVNPDETVGILGGGDISTSSDAEGNITVSYTGPTNLSELTNDVGYITTFDQYKFSVGADDSTLREVGNDESVKFIGGGDISTSSDAEGNITITYNTPANLSAFTNDVGYITTFDQYKFSVGADDSTLIEIGNDESVKFIGGGDVSTSSDAEGNITISYTQPTNVSTFSNDAGYYSAGDTFVGDLKGSVFADDSGTLVDAVAGKIVGEVETTTVNATFITAKDTTVDVITGSGGTFGGNFGTVQYQDSVMTIGHDTLVQIGRTGATNIGVNGQTTSFASGSTINFNNATISGTSFATETYVNNAVANLIDSAPGALDTLNELAAAINDDASFASTITTRFAAIESNVFAIGADDSTMRIVSQGEGIKIIGGGDVSTSSDAEGNITVSFTQDTAFSSLTSVPTTLSGYGITDAATSAQGALADSAVQPGDLAAVATSGAYSDLTGTPSLATVATTGSYNDLADLPVIEDAYKWNIAADDSSQIQVNNDETIKFIGANTVSTSSDAEGNITITGPANLSDLNNDLGFATSALQSGDNVSELVNDAGYITQADVFKFNIAADDSTLVPVENGNTVQFVGGGDVSTSSNADGVITISFSQDFAFSSLTGTPTTLSGYGITDAATSAQGALADSAVQPGDNVSDLTNDAGYLTQQYKFSVGADDSTLREISIDESVKFIGGTNISTSSDAEGNITIDAPSAVSSFTNDSNYVATGDFTNGSDISITNPSGTTIQVANTSTLDSITTRGATTTNTITVGKLSIGSEYSLSTYQGNPEQVPIVEYDIQNYDTDPVFGDFALKVASGYTYDVGTPSATEDGSVKFWLKLRDNTASHQTLIDLGEWAITSNAAALHLFDKSSTYTQISGTLTLDTWYYVEVSFGGGSSLQWILQSYVGTSGTINRYVRTPISKSATEMLNGSTVVLGGTLSFSIDDLHIVNTYQVDPTASITAPTTEATSTGATILLDNFNNAPISDSLGWRTGGIEVGADDSTMQFVRLGEGIKFIGGTNISTSSDADGNITFTNDITNISDLNNDLNFATETYVDNSIADVINGAPGALDTLNELAEALGDDANFASTITNSIATKADKDNLFSIGADDSTLIPISATESIKIIGGVNIDTTSTVNGDIIINGPNSLSDFTNDVGYLTTETDTLNSVVSRGATTTTALTVGNITPSSDSTYALGESGTRWSNVYADNFITTDKIRIGNPSWDTDPRLFIKQSDTEVWLETNVNSTVGSTLGFYKTRGTTSAESAAQDGDNIFEIYGRGLEPGTTNQGSNIVLADWDTVGSISLDVDGADAGSLGGTFTISTKPAGGALSERIKIANNGVITINQAYTLPTADGSANQVLKTNGSGAVSFGFVDYSNVTNTPTTVSTFTNDANYVAQGDNVSDLSNDANYVASGDNISTLTNDAGYYSAGDTFIGDLTGSVFADDSSIVIDGTEGRVFGQHMLPVYTTAELSSIAGPQEGQTIYVSNGDGGGPCLAVYDGSNWRVISLGATL